MIPPKIRVKAWFREPKAANLPQHMKLKPELALSLVIYTDLARGPLRSLVNICQIGRMRQILSGGRINKRIKLLTFHGSAHSGKVAGIE
jgi:hypothetical protein